MPVQVSSAQKQRSGLILSDRSATFRLATTVWPHTAPLRSPKQAWAEAPHRGAQSHVVAPCTGRPEIAVQRQGLIPLELEGSTTGSGSPPRLGANTRPADPSATLGPNPGLVDYRATTPPERPGKLLPADGAGSSPHPLGRAEAPPSSERLHQEQGGGSAHERTTDKWLTKRGLSTSTVSRRRIPG